MNQADRTIDSCYLCSKDFLRWQQSSKSAECKDLAPLNCAFINHCLTTVCYDGVTPFNGSDQTGQTRTYGCRMCKANYKGTGWDSVNNTGSTACVEGMPITNCEYVVGTGASTYNCYSCKAGYSVASTLDSCTTYTTDTNCRVLNSSGACHYCFQSYYWDNTECILSSNLGRNFILIGIILAVILTLI